MPTQCHWATELSTHLSPTKSVLGTAVPYFHHCNAMSGEREAEAVSKGTLQIQTCKTKKENLHSQSGITKLPPVYRHRYLSSLNKSNKTGGPALSKSLLWRHVTCRDGLSWLILLGFPNQSGCCVCVVGRTRK